MAVEITEQKNESTRDTFRTTSFDKKGNLQKSLSNLFPVKSDEGYNLNRYKTGIEAIKEWIKDPFDLSEIEEGVEGGLLGASDVDDIQKALNRKLSKELTRYLKAEKEESRNIFLAPKKVFEMGGELYRQAPDAIVINKKNRTIETIRYKTKAATGITKGIKTAKSADDFKNLEKFYDLYADLLYVRQNIKELWSTIEEDVNDSNYTIACNYYFLKKTSDKGDNISPCFFDDGNTVIGLTELHNLDETDHPTELDDLFKKYIEVATTVGFECDKNNCTYCNYRVICNYQKSRVIADEDAKSSPTIMDMDKVILSDAQQAVIDTVMDGLF